MALEDIVLKYLSVLLTWPVSVAFIVMFVAIKFEKPLSDFIRSAKLWFKAPSGVEFGASSQKQTASTGESDTDEQDRMAEYAEAFDELTKKLAESEGAKDELQTFFKFVWQQMWQYRFRYLSLFLVTLTQTILRKMRGEIPFSRQQLHSAWDHVGEGGHKNVETIIDVLLGEYLVTESEGELKITGAGEEFLYYLDTGEIRLDPSDQNGQEVA